MNPGQRSIRMLTRRIGGKADLTQGEKERSWIQQSRQAKTQKLEWATQEHIFRAGQRPKGPAGTMAWD